MARHTKQKVNPRRKRTLLIIEILCIIVVVICAVIIIQKASEYIIADNEYKEIRKIADTSGERVDKLHEQNPDCVGWLHIDDTRIDYPVMYSPYEPEFYLRRNLEKNYSLPGMLFLGEGCVDGSNSIIIYGHNMRDGSMFSNLHDFADNPEFGKSHSIEYTTTDGTATYRPIATWYEDLSSGSYYRYWDNVGKLTEKEMGEYIKTVQDKSIYDTGYTAKPTDHLLTLSTCSYGTSAERCVVVAVRVKKDQTRYEIVDAEKPAEEQ